MIIILFGRGELNDFFLKKDTENLKFLQLAIVSDVIIFIK